MRLEDLTPNWRFRQRFRRFADAEISVVVQARGSRSGFGDRSWVRESVPTEAGGRPPLIWVGASLKGGCQPRTDHGSVDVRVSCGYGDYMITNLRDAKGRLSELVQRAADGEEIVITVRGEPLARLTAVKAARSPALDRDAWVTELSAAAKAALVGEPTLTSQEFWDGLRGDPA